MIEEQAVVVSADEDFVQVEARSMGGCGACQHATSCGTGLISSLFGRRTTSLRIKNTLHAEPGDMVTVGLNRLAMVIGSLMIYLVPLLMLLTGAMLGEWLATRVAPGYAELFSITSGLVFAVIAFLFSRRVLNSATMARMFQPVLLQRDAPAATRHS